MPTNEGLIGTQLTGQEQMVNAGQGDIDAMSRGLILHVYPVRRGGVRVNLLACLTVATLAFSLGIPAIQRAREAARRMQCSNNAKQLGLALHNYHDVSHAFPYGCVGNSNLPPSKRWSWYLCIGNYMQHYGVPIIDLEKPWDAEEIRPLMLHTWSNGVPPRSKPYTDKGGYYEYDIPLYPFMGLRCPNAPDESHGDGQPFATYIGMAGLGTDAPSLQLSRPRAGAWAFERQTKLQDVTDGSLNTLLLFETARETGCWVAGGKPTVRGADTDSSVPYIVDWPGIGQVGGYHPDGSTAVFVDGRVGFLTTAIHPTVFEATCTISGNETDSSNR